MQLACPTCDKRLQIADEKLPADRKVRITCPACQENFTYNPDGTALLSVSPHFETPSGQGATPVDPSGPAATAPSASAPAATAPAASGPAATAPAASAPAARSAAVSVPTLNLDVIESGPPPRALVCVDDATQRGEYEEMLAALGLSTIHRMGDQVQAMTYLTQVVYDVVILDAKFDGSTLEGNPVLACVAEIPMAQRRNLFVAVCAEEHYVSNAIGAYSQNVNLFFSYTDAREVLHTFEHSMADHKRLYRVYWDVCQELGKE